MARIGLGLSRHRRGPIGVPVTAPPPPPPPPAAPTGFTANGAANAALKAMLTRVAAGTGRGRIVFKGDSTTAGAGGGDPTSTQQLGGARANRTAAVLAARLSAAGYPALDNGVVGDNGNKAFVPLPVYDPRVTLGASSPWIADGGQGFAGGNFLFSPGGGTFDFTPAVAVDRFEVVAFNVGGSYSFLVDGAAPGTVAAPGATIAGGGVSVPGGNAGFTRITVTAAAAGIHSLRVTTSTAAAMRSVMAWANGTYAIDILNHASNGATSADQATAGSNWSNNDSLAFDAPDLTIINLGLNDIGGQVAIAAYRTSLQTIVDTARLSGDVLLVFPHPAGSQFAINPAAYRDAAAAQAAASGVAFLSLFDYFGGAFTPALQARMADGLVHGDAAFYAEVGEVYRQCIAVMAAP
ncbi:SGNH/GDSL hydrolase family protein [Sphingomonas sp.]|uniref:SGNH/GDSL hydrolase family protein n=1 Tax=Sphingomonas sp. TaxID=28214 RepID=UPI003CC6A0A1